MGVQAGIWVSIMLLIVTGVTVCFIGGMDADKHKDTVIYAKFLQTSKDK